MESEDIERVFNKFDTNGDGKISSEELTHVLKALGSDTSPEEVSGMMEEIDTDRDGFISLAEFTNIYKSAAASNGGAVNEVETALKDAFELYDQNKNGLISANELHMVLSKLGESCSVEDCVKMIQSVDSDGDGHVNFDEFKQMMSISVAAANAK